MSNLNQNTVDLQAILDAVNTLPKNTDLTPIIEALTEKGQTVPDGATVDVLASLIAAIEAGGGAFDFSELGGVNTAISGTFSLATSTSSRVLIASGIYDFTPKFAVLYTEDVFTDTTKYKPLAIVQAHITGETGFVLGLWTKGSTSFTNIATAYLKPFLFNATKSITTSKYYDFGYVAGVTAFLFSSGELSIGPFWFRDETNYRGYFEAGVTYKYVVMGVTQ